jgi:PAS domain S-box-containing protein
MTREEKINILLVDDQPAKLLSYEAILYDLGENLLKATSGREALEYLLKSEVAVVLVDVCMPDLDGFQLAAMIREHPRFQKTAMIFISAVHLTEMDRLRGYEMGAVDYVPVPVVPEVLRAKVKIFAELYRKTRELERLNVELEQRVATRTAELETSTAQLLKSEQRRTLAIAAGNMGSWDWDRASGECMWDEGQCRIFGVDPKNFTPSPENTRALIHPDDWAVLQIGLDQLLRQGESFQSEFRVLRPHGPVRWCIGSAAATADPSGRVVRISGVTIDITDRKEAEERHVLLAREVDHRARNALALVQSIIRLTKSDNLAHYMKTVEGRIKALSVAHTILSQSRWEGADLRGLVDEELAPYRTSPEKIVIEGPDVMLRPTAAQSLALTVHELATNAAKYGALSSTSGRIELSWKIQDGNLVMRWSEMDGPTIKASQYKGFGTKIVVESIERQLDGQVTFDWPASGLRCILSVPSDKIKSEGTRKLAPKQSSHTNGTQRIISNNRIMIVEDEILVALALTDYLTDLGFSIVGPFTKLADAKNAVAQGQVDAAILDVNLGGEPIYPLAEILVERNTPFVFTTGYGAESIDARFKNAPVLQKPIEQEDLKRLFVANGGAMFGNYFAGVHSEGGVNTQTAAGARGLSA